MPIRHRPPWAILLAHAVALGVGVSAAPAVHAQPQVVSALPTPRLLIVTPPGGKVGTTVEVTCTGTDLDAPERLVFSHPALKAEPISAPAAPPPDPKKPRRGGRRQAMGTPTSARFKVTIPASVPVGVHDVRLVNRFGVSNARAFVVGDLAEAAEKEPNNDVPQAQRVEINTILNGVIANPTDVDYYVFAGKKGQRIVFSCLATSIDSRLSAGLEVYDTAGRLLAASRNYADDNALTDATLPADGDYFVRVFEFAHARGKPEHFYRLAMRTTPWIDAVHPAVVEPGKTTTVTVYGRNLPGGKPDPTAVVEGRVLEKVTVPVTPPAATAGRLSFNGYLPPASAPLDGFEFRLRNEAGSSNPFLLTLARAPVVLDKGGNDTPDKAQGISLPCEIAGQVEKRRDRDWYVFTAKKGDVLTFELFGDRIGSPAYLYFLLRNAATNADLFESQDENPAAFARKFYAYSKDPQPYRFTVPADGKYLLLVGSRQADSMADPRQFYRVRVGPERPDFQLAALPLDNIRPDAATLLQGGQQAYSVFALRQDGFAGDIALSVEGLPPGVTCPPQTLAGASRQAWLVLEAAPGAAAWTGAVRIKGTAEIRGQKVVREARAAAIVWPVQPNQNIPTIGRLERELALAVRGPAPYRVTTTLDTPAVVQGGKANLKVKVARLWPDFKTPLTVAAPQARQRETAFLPQNLRINNNQPSNVAPNQTEVSLPITVAADVPPGAYTIVLQTQAQIPYDRDPAGKQKKPTQVVFPSGPVTLNVLPKSLAQVNLVNPNLTVKAGGQGELVVRVNRLFGFDGPYKVQVVLPPGVKGIEAGAATVPPGQTETRVVLKAPAGTAPGNRANLIVRVTALFQGTPIVHEVKCNVNVAK